MLKIQKKAQAGTMQSSDLMVYVEPANSLQIEIESTVIKQYDHLIRACATDVIRRMGLSKGHVLISDRGALDYAIRARIETAVRRGASG